MNDLLSFVWDLEGSSVFENGLGVVAASFLLLGALALGLLIVPLGSVRPSLRALAGLPLFFIQGGAAAIGLYLLGLPVRMSAKALVLSAVGLVVLAGVRRAWGVLFRWRELGTLAGLLMIGFVLAWFGWGETRDGTVRAMPGAWGDGPLHTLTAEAFVRQQPTSFLAKLRGAGGGDFSMPAFVGEQLREPFGYDFVAAMLRSAGLTVGGAFTLPAAALLAALLGWIGYLSSALASRRPLLAAGIAGVLTLTFGGLQWIVMANRTGSLVPSRLLGVHDQLWAKMEGAGLVWENHLVLFSSQKHLLLAAAFLSILVVMLLEGTPERSHPSLRFPALWSFSIGTGLLPLFHTHGFLAAGLVWITAAWLSRSRRIVALGALALLLALPVLLWQSGLFGRPQFLSFAPGWMAQGLPVAWLWLWAVNLGAFLPLLALALAHWWRERRVWLLAGPAVILFVAANFVQFQPYRWDNMKLFLLAFLLVLPPVAAELADVRVRGAPFVASLFVLFLSLTTVADLRTYVHLRAAAPVYTPADRAAARTLDRELPSRAVVLANTDAVHNHPLTLTGRKLVAAYAGWLWTRNYAWEERVERMRALRALAPAAQCAGTREYEVTHVVGESSVGYPVHACTVR